jgi:hypothetical protein
MNGVFFDPYFENAVSTNGYIMTYSKSKFIQEFADKIVDFKDMSIIDREFLTYDTVIPKKFQHKVTVNIGKHLLIKKQRRVVLKAFFIKDIGFMILETPPDKFEFAVNPEFLRPLIGHVLELEYNDSLVQIRFTLKEDDSYYVVMPIKV